MNEMMCPRRSKSGVASRIFPGPDHFREDDHTCSYCGSLDPDLFMRRLEAGDISLGTTTKDYKIYVHNSGGEPFIQAYRDCPQGSECKGPDDCTHWTTREAPQVKFYFQHLSAEQKERFVELSNEGKLKFEGGFWFNPLPYFMVPV